MLCSLSVQYYSRVIFCGTWDIREYIQLHIIRVSTIPNIRVQTSINSIRHREIIKFILNEIKKINESILVNFTLLYWERFYPVRLSDDAETHFLENGQRVNFVFINGGTYILTWFSDSKRSFINCTAHSGPAGFFTITMPILSVVIWMWCAVYLFAVRQLGGRNSWLHNMKL